MPKLIHVLRIGLALGLLGVLLLTACGGVTPAPATPAEAEPADEHVQDAEPQHVDEHSPEEHMAGGHDVSEEAAAVPNPIEADDESTATGAGLYAASCAICHGETGEGDGPAAADMEPMPADLHEDHVQELSDGGLFYIISHGKPDTPMPAWENLLTEEERWHVVNFLRTFGK